LHEDNIKTIIKYINAVRVEVNSATNYRRDIIEILTRFGITLKHTCKFKDATRDDILAFLESFRKSESIDPMHKWIGTYNTYQVHLIRFFKWLYAPDAVPDKRPKPAVVSNIPKLKRKEKSIYKPTDLWTPEDDLLFLKYCPTKRDRCYHTISRDLAARPHEILQLKVKDIMFKTVSSGKQYVEVTVNGKTGQRPLPLIDSIPYLKDYLDHEHPQPRNPNAPLICGMGKRLGRHISSIGIAKIYAKYKKEVYPRLLESPTTLAEDKPRIAELLKKPWNPYVRRHSSLTQKSVYLKEHVLRQMAGWSPGSQMHLRYLHYFGSENVTSILEEYGLIDKGTQLDPLRSKQCPNCMEQNKPDSKFCVKCRMVLSYDSYNETIENQKEKEDRLTTIENQFNIMQSQIHSLLSSLGSIQDQNQVNQMAKTLYNSRIIKKEDDK
jgi:integrase